jgi:hypothetical protein
MRAHCVTTAGLNVISFSAAAARMMRRHGAQVKSPALQLPHADIEYQPASADC